MDDVSSFSVFNNWALFSYTGERMEERVFTMHKTVKYFVNGHTARGYVNYLHSNIEKFEKVVVLQNGNYLDVTTLFIQLLREHDAIYREVICDPQGIDAIGGVLFQDKQLAIIHESIIDEAIIHAEYINLEDYYDRPPHKINKQEVDELYQASYALFKKGLDIHDQLEQIYVNEMNFAEANRLANHFIEKLLQYVEKKTRPSMVKKRLFGTNTLEGMVNVVEKLIEPIENRVYVKGRAGTGKSVFMKKVWQACEAYGLDIEVYYCSFDPNSIDMVLVRELDFCIFDSTDPHEFSPQSNEDIVIDLYELTVTPNTDEKYKDEIEQLTSAYKQNMKSGITNLKEIKKIYPNQSGNLDVKGVIHSIYLKK